MLAQEMRSDITRPAVNEERQPAIEFRSAVCLNPRSLLGCRRKAIGWLPCGEE